jgi:WD40 repeat protein
MDCAILSGAQAPITSAAVSPEDNLIITGEKDGSVKLWSVSDLSIEEELTRHNGEVTGVGFIGDSHKTFSAGLDGVVRFIDRNGRNHFDLPQMDPITASDVSRDGSVVVVGEVRLAAVDGGWRNIGDGSMSACDSGVVSAWDISSHWVSNRKSQLKHPLWRIHLANRNVDHSNNDPQSPTFIRISPDLRLVGFSRIIAGMNPGELEFVSLKRGHPVTSSYWGNPGFRPVAAEFIAGSERIIIVTWQGLLLQEREVTQQKCKAIYLEEYRHDPKEGWPHTLRSDTHWAPWWAPSAVSSSIDGRYMLIASRYGKIRIYDIPNRRRIAQLTGHSGEVSAARFFSSLKYAMSAGMDGTLRIWKLPQLETE